MLKDWKWHVFDPPGVRITDNYLVVTNVMEILSVDKLANTSFDSERYDLEELNEVSP